MRFYIDTSIWIDLIEDRIGFNGEPLGDYALKLFALIREEQHGLVISDLLMIELNSFFSMDQINGMLLPFKNLLFRVFAAKHQRDEADIISAQRNLPPGDVLHAIIARDKDLILITRDKHFRCLRDIVQHYRPEEIT